LKQVVRDGLNRPSPREGIWFARSRFDLPGRI